MTRILEERIRKDIEPNGQEDKMKFAKLRMSFLGKSVPFSKINVVDVL